MKIIETERTILREMDADDGAFMLDLLNQPSFIKNIGDRNVRLIDEAREYIESRFAKSYRENGFGFWAVELKTNAETPPQVIGICGFVKRDSLPHVDVGFAFLPQFEKKGYAFETAAAIMKYGRNVLRFGRVLAITTPENESSMKLLGKLGFEFTELIEMPDGEKLNLFSSDGEAGAAN